MINNDYQNEILKLKKQVERLKKSVKKQKYGLVWMDVPEAFEDDIENKLPILKEVPELAIKNDDGKPTHILIEGDNYHALTCLNYTHKEKIDVIYIDPPYNTGSDGFKYKDKRVLDKYPDGTEVPKDHPLRHSYWLSFMKKRLDIAKNLLKPEGVIFISINEEEFAQLKLLCDEIFQLSNYLTTFTIKLRHENRILKGDKDFHEVVEYLLMYRKSPKYKTIKRTKDNSSIDNYIYEIHELSDSPETVKMGNKLVEIYKEGEYSIEKVEPNPNALKKINIRGSIKEGNSSGRFYMKFLEKLNTKGVLYKVPNMGNDYLGFRYFLTPLSNNRVNGDYFQGIPLNKEDTKEVPYPNYFDFEEIFNNVGYEGGVNFGGGKKPVEFLKQFIRIGTNKKNAIILDFFAGSGSTGQAVLELNNQDDGKRQFILCTNNEGGIMMKYCYPRISNVIGGFEGNKTMKKEVFSKKITLNTLKNVETLWEEVESSTPRKLTEGETLKYTFKNDELKVFVEYTNSKKYIGLGNSCRYFKSAFVGKRNILNIKDEDKVELAHNAGELLALSENTLDLINKDDWMQLYENNDRYTAIYFREEMTNFEKFKSSVKKLDKPVSIYVFSWGDNEFPDDFAEIKDAKVKTIPAPILEIYKQIYKQIYNLNTK